MVVVPLSKSTSNPHIEPAYRPSGSNDLVRIGAGVALLAGGLLLLNRKYKAGLVAASSGTALALLDQQEIVRSWWDQLPILIDQAGQAISQVEHVVEDIAAQRDRLRALLRR
jgi:hypothetical protein